MTCSQLHELIPDYLAGSLMRAAQEEVAAHLATCAGCQQEVANLESMWTQLGSLPKAQPSEASRARFYAMLEAYEHGLQHEPRLAPSWRERFNAWLERWWPKQPLWQLGFAAAFMLLGIFIGQRFTSPSPRGGEIVQMRMDLQNMQQMVALSLLQQPSPSDRLRGVSWVHQMQAPDQEVLNVLLQTLNEDPNVNVRLAAAEALGLYGNEDLVRQGIVASLPRQTSPLVQIRLIILLTELREKKAHAALQQLMQNEQLNQEVRKQAEIGLKELY
ncbi:HEAT repeat domain-containing protein [candidate division KSB1 bacterium]|nr:HEAT repeat domain-containing protein [candidate division KSB1 bacterium]